jgi:hypothetical protein
MASVVRKHLVNIVLAAVAAGLIIALIVTKSGVTTTEQEARPNNVLAAWRDDDLRRIELERAKDGWVLESRPTVGDDAGDRTWFIAAPVKEEADAYAIDKLSGSLEFATAVRRIKPEEVDRAAFGLDAPRWVMKVEMGAIHYRLALGKEAASPPGSAYLEVSGEGVVRAGVVIVSRDLIKELEIDADTLRGRQIMPYLSDAVDKIELEGAGGSRKLRRAEWGGFRFDGMQGDLRVSREALDRVLLQFARTKAEHFIPVAAADAALGGAERVKITMLPTNKQQPRAVVEVGGRCPATENDVVAIRREPDALAACVPKSVMPGLSTSAEELVDHTLFALRTDEVEGLSIVQGARKLELERKGVSFVMRAPIAGDVELDAGNQRIESVIASRGEIVSGADPKKLGLDPPPGNVTLRSSATTETKVRTEVVAVSAPSADGSVHVRRQQDGAVLKLEREAARAITPDATLVKSKKLLDFSTNAFRSVEIRSASQTQRLIRNQSGSFTLEEPKGFEVDGGLASDLVEALRTLTAERWVADKAEPAFGLESPAIKARVRSSTADAAEREVVLSIGAPASGGSYAQLEADPGVFVLSKNVVEYLDTLLVDRSVMLLVEDEVTRASVESGTKRAEFLRRGSNLASSGGNVELTPAQARTIIDALASMRAEAATHLGAARAEEGFAKPELVVRLERGGGQGARSKPIVYRIGSGDSWRGISVHHARVEGIDATFVVARSKVRRVLDAL